MMRRICGAGTANPNGGWHLRRKPVLGASLAALSVGFGAPAMAQQPEQQRVAPLSAHLVTPAKEEFSQDLIERLQVPEGFAVDLFVQDLENPRVIVVHESGTVYVSERDEERVLALRDTNADGQVDSTDTVASDLPFVHGLAIHDGRLYMATNTELYAAPIEDDGLLGEVEQLRDGLPQGGQHPNRTIAFDRDGSFFVSVGSTCNACDEPDDRHATLLRGDPESGELEIFAEGLRNTIGFAWHPDTGELWGMDHGSDWRGDDQPPEELNRIEEGKDYGWPWCFADRQADDYIPGEPEGYDSREVYCEQTEPPVLTYQAHSAPMTMAFYTGDQFPDEYQGDAFVAMRGSWNRNPPVGYEVVRLRFEDGQPVEFEDFLTGFLSEDGETHFARLTGVAIALDGSLLVTDDTNGVIYRVSYDGS